MMREETFTEIYERYAVLIMKSVMDQTNNIELAEEICQQTFLKYLEKKETVIVGFERPWLLEVAQNLLIDRWKKASTRKEFLEKETENSVFDNIVDSVNVEEQVTNRMFTSDLMKELKVRNPLWYDVIYHVLILQESYAEAAEILHTNPDALRARYKRALDYVRGKYGDEYL